MYPICLAYFERGGTVVQSMDSKHIVLSKSNHQDGNDDLVKKRKATLPRKRDVEIVGHTYTHMHTHTW